MPIYAYFVIFGISAFLLFWIFSILAAAVEMDRIIEQMERKENKP